MYLYIRVVIYLQERNFRFSDLKTQIQNRELQYAWPRKTIHVWFERNIVTELRLTKESHIADFLETVGSYSLCYGFFCPAWRRLFSEGVYKELLVYIWLRRFCDKYFVSMWRYGGKQAHTYNKPPIQEPIQRPNNHQSVTTQSKYRWEKTTLC